MPIQVIQPDIRLPKQQKIGVYTAILTQTGTAAPTALVLHNSLSDGTPDWLPGQYNIAWTRNNIGDYTGTLNQLFIPERTWLNIQTSGLIGSPVTQGGVEINGNIQLYNYSDTWTLMDEMVCYIEIRLYKEE